MHGIGCVGIDAEEEMKIIGCVGIDADEEMKIIGCVGIDAEEEMQIIGYVGVDAEEEMKMRMSSRKIFRCICHLSLRSLNSELLEVFHINSVYNLLLNKNRCLMHN